MSAEEWVRAVLQQAQLAEENLDHLFSRQSQATIAVIQICQSLKDEKYLMNSLAMALRLRRELCFPRRCAQGLPPLQSFHRSRNGSFLQWPESRREAFRRAEFHWAAVRSASRRSTVVAPAARRARRERTSRQS